MDTNYLIEFDTDVTGCSVTYSGDQYVEALEHLCRLLRDHEVFNVRFTYLFYNSEWELVSAIPIKVQHVNERPVQWMSI